MAKPRKIAGIKVVDVAGSPSSIGRTLGRSCKGMASTMLAEARVALEKKGVKWPAAIELTKHYRPYCEEYDPDFVEMVEGYADGSGVTPEEILVLICMDEKGFCTDIAANGLVTEDGSVLHAHTEDWSEASQKSTLVVRGRPKGGLSFLAATHGGIEFIAGINSAGLSFTGNSLYPNDERVGLPKKFQAWRLVTSKSISDAMEAALPPHRGSSYNVNLCHKSGEMYCLEGSATSHAVLYATNGYLVHTNHYLDPGMQRFEACFGTETKSLAGASGTVVRYHRALRLTRNSLGHITKDSLKAILTDHVNRPRSICNHPDMRVPKNERGKTVFAVVFDLSSLKMDFCLGNPCSGRFVEFELS